MQKQFPVQIAVLAVLVSASAGCNGGDGGEKEAAAKPSPSPVAKAKTGGLPLEAQSGNLDLTLLDEKDRIIVQVTAKAGAVGPGKPGTEAGGVVGSLSQGTAILYQEGKPAAKLTADSVRAEQETRIVTAKGNATVTSLSDPNSPAIRADTMIWRYETGTITGTGNVLATRKPDLSVPGTFFTADTRLQRFKLTGGAGSGTGTL